MTARLTDAEWQIMRILWERGECAAADATEALRDAREWSPTTVKTFLTRLENKGLVDHRKTGRMFVYSPRVTERSCVVAEMKAVLDRVYGGRVRHETEHFRFYGVDDVPLSIRLARKLEESCAHFERVLGYALDDKQPVYLYASRLRLHSALGLTEAPDWLRAGSEWDVLHIAPEAAFDDLPIEAAAVHVWTQRVLRDVNANAPVWLTRGIAAHEAGWPERERIGMALRPLLATFDERSVAALPERFDRFRDLQGYELASDAIDYVLERFGWDRLALFLKRPHDYVGAFGIAEPAFWSGWLARLAATSANESGRRT